MLLFAKALQLSLSRKPREKAKLGFKYLDTQAVSGVCVSMLCLPTLIIKCASETLQEW